MPGMINRVQRELKTRSAPADLLMIVTLAKKQTGDTARQMSMQVVFLVLNHC